MPDLAVLLVGDSHLARLGPDVPALGARVTNRAVGGAFSTDLAAQVEGVDLTAYDVVVVSVGTNDAAPWKQVPIHVAERALASFVTGLPCPLVLVAPPGVEEDRLVRSRDRSNSLLAEYSRCAAEVVAAAGGALVDSPEVLSPLGPAAFLPDGVHLTPAGYARLVPAVAEAVDSLLEPAAP